MKKVTFKRMADGNYRFVAKDGREFVIYKWYEWVAQCCQFTFYARTLKELKEKLSAI